VCENWKGYVVKYIYIKYDVLMTILDKYMFRPLACAHIILYIVGP